MGDILCAKCGEPWDSYGVREGDMTKEEAARFRRGEGCPCCGFGSQCPLCDGSGRESSYGYGCKCELCHDKGYVLAWSPSTSARGFAAGEFYTGYSPRVTHISKKEAWTAKQIGERFFPEKIREFTSLDGRVLEFWVLCPSCKAEGGITCERCGGTGKLDIDPELDLEAAKSEIDNSDEDPMDILATRGLI